MIRVLFIIVFLSLAVPAYSFLSDEEIASFQKELQGKTVSERIAFWAEKFVGTPYDPDPLGEYVTKKVIVADERVDCMYLSFRTLELSLGKTPSEALMIALDKRFIDKGRIVDGKVVNYENRFEYGEDMLDSGKWGREITEDYGPVTEIKGSRGREKVKIISKEALQVILVLDVNSSCKCKGSLIHNGDMLFFIKSPDKRVADEIVGHIGIVKKEDGVLYLIHASGSKNRDGVVKKVLLYEYIKSMPFIGVRLSRFD
ncbi:MAG: hypothetical protein OEZ31_09245 [Nitrospirota bacterium]|nr:hypothetical protein [Nitrospirota bacterium]MDH5769127.1 hypothetical protein [Nitrospirota bacterium]